MQQIHAEGSVRHAEKRRRGTCQFANHIAHASLDAYERSVPKSYRDANKQTCVAAIVAHIRGTSNDNGEGGNHAGTSSHHLQVMGLGVGTKFLPNALLREEQLLGESDGRHDEQYGKRIRDCHAEVLARRAFKCQISLEILSDLKCSKDGCEKQDGCEEGAVKDTGYVPVLERVKDGGADSHSIIGASNIRYRLRPDVTLHFYASSAPCGNATLKKFIKMEKEKFDASLGPYEWPEQIHAPIQAHSIRLGQFALLVKKDGSVVPQPKTDEEDGETSTTQQLDQNSERQAKRRKKKPWPCRESDTWCPPSCSMANFDKGTIHSCSDKVCRWNCLGMQGSLLMPVLEDPLYMTTLTVGRKFSRAICQRAVCCRADGFGSGTKCSKDGSNGNMAAASLGKFKVNHPALMETNVYMDESGTHDMTGVKSVGQDARFDSNLCWVWWPDKSMEVGYEADCIDGRTGLKIKYQVSSTEKDDGNQESIVSTFSACSTFGLFHLNLEILLSSSKSNLPGNMKNQSNELSISGLRQMKHLVSAQYESAKADFLCHRVFNEWSCRDCR